MNTKVIVLILVAGINHTTNDHHNKPDRSLS